MTNEQQLQAYRSMTAEQRVPHLDRIRELEAIVPTTCCVCGDEMKGRHPTWSWCCSSNCAREHYD